MGLPIDGWHLVVRIEHVNAEELAEDILMLEEEPAQGAAPGQGEVVEDFDAADILLLEEEPPPPKKKKK